MKTTNKATEQVEFVGVCKRCGRVISNDECSPCGLVGVLLVVRADSLRSIEVVSIKES